MRAIAAFLFFLALPVSPAAGFRDVGEQPLIIGNPHMEEVRLPTGINRVDLNDDGEMDVVVVAHRGNFNAHGYTVYQFMISDQSGRYSHAQWLLVPFEKVDTTLIDHRTTIEGADCILQSVRLFRCQRRSKNASAGRSKNASAGGSDGGAFSFFFSH